MILMHHEILSGHVLMFVTVMWACFRVLLSFFGIKVNKVPKPQRNK